MFLIKVKRLLPQIRVSLVHWVSYSERLFDPKLMSGRVEVSDLNEMVLVDTPFRHSCLDKGLTKTETFLGVYTYGVDCSTTTYQKSNDSKPFVVIRIFRFVYFVIDVNPPFQFKYKDPAMIYCR